MGVNVSDSFHVPQVSFEALISDKLTALNRSMIIQSQNATDNENVKPLVWNALPIELRTMLCINDFNKYLETCLFNEALLTCAFI